MSTSAIILTNRFTLLVIILAALSCDSFTESDSVTPEKFTQSDYYILPGTSAIIDLESVIDQSFLNGTLSISENPKRGTLSYVTTSLLKYKPGREFQEGEDHFVLSVVSDGKILAKGTMTIKMKKSNEEFPCSLVPIEDKIKLKAGSTSVSTRVLENDWFCDIEKSNVSISIESQPEFGHAIIESESIVYTPAVEYKDRDELIYKVTQSTGEIVSYGLLSFHGYGEITIRKIPDKVPVTSLCFLDEDTGFLGTRRGLYKTTDGGNNWDAMVPNLNLNYNNVFFLDEKNGFATHSSDRLNSRDILTITKDGGVTWKEQPLSFGQYVGYTEWQFAPVTSIVFTSKTTGFIVLYFEGDYSFGVEHAPFTEVMKTEDGGVTWKAVLSSDVWGYGRGSTDIQFINQTTCYATLSERIFVTKDTGETWTELFAHQWIDHVQVTEENKLFAVLSDDETSIITSQDGSNWRPVAHFSSNIFSLGFAPSAEVGFALVRDGDQNTPNNPDLQPISIFKTVDKGETWLEEPMDEKVQGFPLSMSIPSSDVAYFLCYDRIIKYSTK